MYRHGNGMLSDHVPGHPVGSILLCTDCQVGSVDVRCWECGELSRRVYTLLLPGNPGQDPTAPERRIA